MTGPLDGIRVVDLTRARSGPTCVRQLADLGADVVQVSDPRAGDIAGSDSANLQRNKRSVALDLHHPDGLAAFLALTDRADVFVENMRPSVKHRLGIGPDVLLDRNPRLVYASISGFGQTGPYAERGGLDQVAQGMGGVMSVTGPPGSGPWRVGHRDQRHRVGHVPHPGRARRAVRPGAHRPRAVGPHVVARGDGQLHGLPGVPVAHRRRGAAAAGQRPPDVLPDGDLPVCRRLREHRRAQGPRGVPRRARARATCSTMQRFATDEARKANRVAFNAACEERLATMTGARRGGAAQRARHPGRSRLRGRRGVRRSAGAAPRHLRAARSTAPATRSRCCATR